MTSDRLGSLKGAAIAGNARGILLILLASCFAVASSALTKQLANDYSAAQIIWLRAGTTLALLLPFLIRSRFKALWPARPRLMMVRSLNAAVLVGLNVYAVGNMPLVDFTAIGFTTPIFVIGLSFVILRQVPQLERSLLTLIGFAGVMLIVQPSGDLSTAFLAAVGGAFCMGLGLIFIRLLARTESQLRLLLWSNALLFLLICGPAINAWKTPDPLDWVTFVAAGGLGTLTQLALLMGYEAGEPTVIAPFDYSRILIAVAVGALYFGEVPTLYTWIGTALVIGAGILIARRR